MTSKKTTANVVKHHHSKTVLSDINCLRGLLFSIDVKNVFPQAIFLSKF